MKKRTLIPVIGLLVVAFTTVTLARIHKTRAHNPYSLQNGDIVFQETNSTQAKAIKAATNSRWSHVGLIFLRNGKPHVIEAVQPVKVTPLSTFIARNPSSFYAMRLKKADQHITPDALQKAETYCNAQLGKNYDSHFLWSDDRIYCSELVWKIYKQAIGIELCKPRAFNTYNLRHPHVQRIIRQRYGSIQNLPLTEPSVAPSDIAKSPLLVEVPKRSTKKNQ